ncbi:ABC transporter permease [Actinomadura flavalba]|uniref:ABC transporter permease n=1 Tax=Actinomadura flavalba TaxID=1120938 RepID=UPI0003668A8E|nr:ABC transporter permease [Actinomadura flavalba]
MNTGVVRSLTRALFVGFVRDRAALFYTLLFPLFFLVVFAGVFGSADSPRVEVARVAPVPLLDQALAHDPGLRDTIEVTAYRTPEAAVRAVEKGDADAFAAQDGGTLSIRYSVADRVQSGIVQSLFGGLTQAANRAATGERPAYRLEARQVEDASLSAIQFFTPGLLGWALSMAGVFGASTTLVTWRKNGLLRRLRLSPAPLRSVFAARVLVSLVTALIQLAVFLGVALLPVFGLRLTGAWWMSIPLVLAGVLAFLGIGMLVGAWARTQEAASAVTQLIVLPMAFLGGSFFPLDSAPGWMRTLSYVFPLRYLNDGMLDVMARGLGPASALPQIAALLAVAVVTSLAAARIFRWDAT